jgi:hypothetical protein
MEALRQSKGCLRELVGFGLAVTLDQGVNRL